jgi:hypothetical protein
MPKRVSPPAVAASARCSRGARAAAVEELATLAAVTAPIEIGPQAAFAQRQHLELGDQVAAWRASGPLRQADVLW